MILYSQYESFFSAIATSFTPIGHTPEAPKFATLDIDDILSGQRGNLDFTSPVMLLENPEGGLGYKHDRLLDQNFGAFHILQHVSRGNPEDKRTVMDNCKSYGAEIIAHIQLQKIERMKGDNTIPRMLLYFDPSQVQYQKVGPLFSDCYGWRFEFNLGEESPITTVYNPDNWT